MATSMFSRRHYEAIAEIIRDAGNDTNCYDVSELWDVFRERFATMFEADNPRFDRAKWEEACER